MIISLVLGCRAELLDLNIHHDSGTKLLTNFCGGICTFSQHIQVVEY